MSDEYRKLRFVKFYKDRVNVGTEGYNPKVTGTVTGGGDMSQVVDHETCFDPWVKV